MDFFCTSDFQATFNAFTKKPKRQLHSFKTDIPKLFTQENLEKKQWEWAIPIFVKDQLTLLKIRVRNSAKGFGKSYGFRLHFAFKKDTQAIIFFGLLAKSEKASFTYDEYLDLVETLVNETASNELIPLDLSSGSIESMK